MNTLAHAFGFTDTPVASTILLWVPLVAGAATGTLGLVIMSYFIATVTACAIR